MKLAEKVERFCGTIKRSGTAERSTRSNWNDLERFRVTAGNTTEKSGTIFQPFWNGPHPVPTPRFLERGGVERIRKGGTK